MPNIRGTANLLAEAMNEFISATGGNLDHRAACNRDRKALMAFLDRCLSIMPTHHYGQMDLMRAAQMVLDERLPQLTCQTEAPVYTKS